MNILYIDDEPELLELIPCYLEGHNFTLAADLNTGLKSLKAAEFDLVIVDFLPNLGSLKIIEECHGLKIKVILFTGNDDLQDIPIEHVIIKPNMTKLMTVLKEVEDEIKK